MDNLCYSYQYNINTINIIILKITVDHLVISWKAFKWSNYKNIKN